MKKIICFLILLFIISFSGCKKEQPSGAKPMAGKVQTQEEKKEMIALAETQKVEQEFYTYDAKDRRDPFLSLITITTKKPSKRKGANPFESYDVNQITLLAIAWDAQKYYALIMLPDRKSYTITEGMKLGLFGGKVEKITEDKVVIREYIQDYKGDLKQKDSILKLRTEGAE